jgi:hypothetical protein
MTPHVDPDDAGGTPKPRERGETAKSARERAAGKPALQEQQGRKEETTDPAAGAEREDRSEPEE